jgi:hypothetical protein
MKTNYICIHHGIVPSSEVHLYKYTKIGGNSAILLQHGNLCGGAVVHTFRKETKNHTCNKCSTVNG